MSLRVRTECLPNSIRKAQKNNAADLRGILLGSAPRKSGIEAGTSPHEALRDGFGIRAELVRSSNRSILANRIRSVRSLPASGLVLSSLSRR